MLLRTVKQGLITIVVIGSLCVYYLNGKWFDVFIAYNNQKANVYYTTLLAKVEKKEVTGIHFFSLVKKRVNRFPNEAQGWYLLSKLEQGRDEIKKAYMAAKHAYQLMPNDVLLGSNYLELLFLYNQGQLTREASILIKKIQLQEPDNVIAANISALLAYNKKNYRVAIKQWKRLLKHEQLTINEKEDYEQLINKAQQLLLRQYPMQLVIDYKLEAELFNNKKSKRPYLYVSVRDKEKLEPLWILKKDLVKTKKNKVILTVNNARHKILKLPIHKELTIEIRLSKHSNRLKRQGDLFGTKTFYLTDKNKFIAHALVLINRQFL